MKKRLFKQVAICVAAIGALIAIIAYPFITGGADQAQESEVVIGTPSDTTDDVTIYFDYQCSWCALLEARTGEELLTRVDAGDVVLHLRPANVFKETIPEPESLLATLYYVNEHAPDKTLEYHNKLFERISSAAGGKFSLDDARRVAESVGVPKDVAAKMTHKNLDLARVEDSTKSFNSQGYDGVPVLKVNDRIIKDWPDKTLDQIIQEEN